MPPSPLSPLHLLVEATHPAVAALLAERLSGAASCRVAAVSAGVGERRLLHAPDVPPAARREVTRLLEPLSLSEVVDPSQPPGTARVVVAQPAGVMPVNLTVRSDSARAAARIASLLAPYCEGAPRVLPLPPGEPSRMRFGGADRFLLDLAGLAARLEGADLAPRGDWEPEDLDLHVDLRAAPTPAGGFAEPVELACDDPDACRALADRLAGLGFQDVRIVPLAGDPGETERFRLAPGALAARVGDAALHQLRGACVALLAERGVDPASWPLDETVPDEDEFPLARRRRAPRPPEALNARVTLPLARHARGDLRPYAGSSPRRFAVEVCSDDEAWRDAAAAALEAAGFGRPACSPLSRTDAEPKVELDELVAEPDLLARLIEAVDVRGAGRLDPTPTPGLGCGVRVVFPRHLSPTERRDRQRAGLRRYRVVVHGALEGRHPFAQRVAEALRQAGFTRVRLAPGDGEPAGLVRYGGADAFALDAVTLALESVGVTTVTEQAWPTSDRDIFVFAPDTAMATRPGTDPFAAWDARQDAPEASTRRRAREFLSCSEARLRVGGRHLARRPGGPRRPGPGFETYVVDAATARTLAHVALSVLRREPVLLEGATSTSKTSVILYLAALLGQPVVRVNLSAHTDASELLGRYLPAEGAGGRAGWRWQDGRVVRALREGAWVVLDELNLAEPAVLERLNPLLEREPSLVLTEHDGEAFGPGGTPVHPDFRVFATMNPSTYGGRSVLSPAFRDRFLGYLAVHPPTEDDLRGMLARLVLGEGHAFELEGVRWRTPGGVPPLPWRGVGARATVAVTRQLARLQVSLAEMGASEDAERRDPPVYTRRGLLAVVEAVSRDLDDGATFDDALRDALCRYVVARAATPAERTAVAHVLDACGLGPGCWTPGGELPVAATAPPPSAPEDDQIPFFLRAPR